MSSPLGTDTQQLAAAAATLSGLVGDRVQSEQRVTEVTAQLAQSFKGQAGQALQQILSNYVSASEALRREEGSIAEKLSQAGIAYSTVDQAAAELTGQAEQIEGLLSQEREVLTTLGVAWTGDGSTAWQHQQQRWQQRADDLNAALRSLTSAVNEVVADMKKHEAEIGSQFG
jgi:WXG100 family type VII secretion target